MDVLPVEVKPAVKNVERRHTSVLKYLSGAGVMAVLGYVAQNYVTKDAGDMLGHRIDEANSKIERVEKTYLERSEANTNRIMAHVDRVGAEVTDNLRRELKALEERTLKAETDRDRRIEANRLRIEDLYFIVGKKPSDGKTNRESL